MLLKSTKKIKLGKNHKKLINNLEEYRKSAKLTQEELSIKAEVSEKASTQLKMEFIFHQRY